MRFAAVLRAVGSARKLGSRRSCRTQLFKSLRDSPPNPFDVSIRERPAFIYSDLFGLARLRLVEVLDQMLSSGQYFVKVVYSRFDLLYRNVKPENIEWRTAC